MTFRTKDRLRTLLVKLGVPTSVAMIGWQVLRHEDSQLAQSPEPIIVVAYPSTPVTPDEPHTHVEIEEPMPPASHFAEPASTTSGGTDLSWLNNSQDVANQIASRRRVYHPALYETQSGNAALWYEAVRSTQAT